MESPPTSGEDSLVIYLRFMLRHYMTKPVILLIDDERAYAEVIRDALIAYGIEVRLAHNAMEALEAYQDKIPDLILLDVMMPEVDGLTLLKWLREHSEKDRVPIHIVSAKAQEKDRDAALKAGADGFMAKPFTIEELKALIARTLSNGHRRSN
jgi:DNA-binding response OmpR family regulator